MFLVVFSSQKCSAGLFGLNCKYHCDCHEEHTKSCNHITGECVCNPDFEGPKCEHKSVCPSGKYGRNCLHNCNCNDERLSCDYNDGDNCFCPLGRYGNHCEQKV